MELMEEKHVRHPEWPLLTSAEHRKFFYQFAYHEIASGGPDPHLAMAVESARQVENYAEKVWRGGCYLGVYNWPSGEAIWRAWPFERMCREGNPGMLKWLHDNWGGLRTRVERRSIRTPETLFRYLSEFTRWVFIHQAESWFKMRLGTTEHYEQAWQSCTQVYSLGRYLAHKLLEFGRLACGWNTVMPDIRPRDGWSPRWTLAQLFPEAPIPLDGGNTHEEISAVNVYAADLLNMLRDRLPSLDFFRLQVLLCEYRESVERLRQYPGRSHDSELGYYKKIAPYWENKYDGSGGLSMFKPIRAQLFPHKNLGELNGWTGSRDELGEVVRRYRYTWSDLLYNYHKSAGRLNDPMLWSVE